MKPDDIKIFRLEDRILFEAAAAAEIVDAANAVQENPNANVSETERQAQEEVMALKNAPVENNTDTKTEALESLPADIADVDAEINALIEGVVPSAEISAENDSDFVSATFSDNGVTLSTDRELVVINSSLAEIDSLLAELQADQDHVILDSQRGLAELTEYLENHDGSYSAIHFLTHGSDGELVINGEVINNDSFDPAVWQTIGEYLTEDGEILFYGCDVAETAEGQQLVDRIAEAGGCDVAASEDFPVTGIWNIPTVSLKRRHSALPGMNMIFWKLPLIPMQNLKLHCRMLPPMAERSPLRSPIP